MEQRIFDRPWGSYEILSEFPVNDGDVCVKTLKVSPGQRLSYQRHQYRDEKWVVVQGLGVVVLDDIEIPVQPGDVVQIKKLQKHRLINTGDAEELIVIETMLGHYDEDDIERFADDYGRLDVM